MSGPHARRRIFDVTLDLQLIEPLFRGELSIERYVFLLISSASGAVGLLCLRAIHELLGQSQQVEAGDLMPVRNPSVRWHWRRLL